jgi:hypothetical protein
MERYVRKHQKEPGHQARDTASPVDNVRSPEPRTVAGPSSTDEFKLPEGHTRHELSMPPELAKDFLDGRFAETFPHYKLVEETGEIALKRA